MNNNARAFFAALILSCSVLLFATAQQGDNLLLNGKQYSISSNPLEPYLEQHPEKRPKSEVMSTSLWRGYVATWEVKNNRLMLTDVAIERSVTKPGQRGFETELSSVMSSIFPEQKSVPATWFSGHLIIPDGKLVHYVHMGYASTYAHYIIVRVEKGEVTRQWDTDAKGFAKFSKEQFESFKQTDEYRQALADAEKQGGMTSRQNEEFLRQYFSGRYTSMIFEGR